MTIDIDAIRTREAAATKGPWTTGASKEWSDALPPWALIIDGSYPLTELQEGPQGAADAEFIAAARTDVPALLARVDEQAAEIQRLRASGGNWVNCTPAWLASRPAGACGDTPRRGVYEECTEHPGHFVSAGHEHLERSAEIHVLNGMVDDAKYTVGQVLAERDAARQEITTLTGEIDDRDSEISTLRQDLDFQTKAAFDNQAEIQRLRAVAEAVTALATEALQAVQTNPLHTDLAIKMRAALGGTKVEPVEPQYLIWSHHYKMWLGPDGSGYHNHIADAGRYALAATKQWLGRGCGCCMVPEVVVPAPPLVTFESPSGLAQFAKEQIHNATARRIGAGQVNTYAAISEITR